MFRRQLWANVVLVAFVVGGCGAGVGPATSAPPTATAPPEIPTTLPSSAPVCADPQDYCAGVLSTGAHATAKFDHPFTFETPEGWANIADRDKSYLLSASAAPESEFIVWSHAAIADQPPNCDPARKAGVGNAAADWLASLAADPRVDVSSPVAFDLGSYQAKSVEVTVKDSWTALCPFNTSPFVILVSDTGNPPTRHHGLGNDGQAYLAFIDVGGEAIVIWVDGGKGQPFASMLALAHPVIESIRFQ